MTRRFLLLAAAGALSACATAPPVILAPEGAALAELEPLYAAWTGREAVVIRVASAGCTAKADFTFYLERRGQAATLAFGRRRAEACKDGRAGHADLTFSYAELGLRPGEPVFLLNPLAAGR